MLTLGHGMADTVMKSQQPPSPGLDLKAVGRLPMLQWLSSPMHM